MTPKIFPNKLKKGDEIRVIAPALSLQFVSKANCEYAKSRIEQLGFKVTFGKHVNEEDMLNSSSVNSRLEDLHAALITDPRNTKVKPNFRKIKLNVRKIKVKLNFLIFF